MKRILTLLAAAMMVLGAVSVSSAAELSASGQIHTGFIVTDNANFDKNTREDNFVAASRVRTRFEYKVSDNLRGVWEVQVGNWEWGKGNAALNNGRGSDDDDFRTRLAYITFTLPNTSVGVNMGIQYMAVPSATFGSSVINNRVAGVTVSAPLADGISLTGLWARPAVSSDEYDTNTGIRTTNRNESYNSFDVFGAIAGLDFGVANISPYLLYARAGHDSGAGYRWVGGDADDYSHWYAAGAAIEINPIELLTLKMDATYATVKNDSTSSLETDGFMVVVLADFNMPFGTPGVFGWYSSGADKKGKGYMPILGNDGGFGPTSLMTDGSLSLGRSAVGTGTGIGTMAVGAQVADMSFIDNLSHTARVVYMMGTNDKKSTTSGGPLPAYNDLTGVNEEISAIELNFDTTYQLMENLTTAVELGYVIFDSGDLKYEEDNMFNANIYFMLNF